MHFTAIRDKRTKTFIYTSDPAAPHMRSNFRLVFEFKYAHECNTTLNFIWTASQPAKQPASEKSWKLPCALSSFVYFTFRRVHSATVWLGIVIVFAVAHSTVFPIVPCQTQSTDRRNTITDIYINGKLNNCRRAITAVNMHRCMHSGQV